MMMPPFSQLGLGQPEGLSMMDDGQEYAFFDDKIEIVEKPHKPKKNG